MTMNRLHTEVNKVENWGGQTSKSFKSFGTKFKNSFQKELDKMGAKITAFNKGHYYLSGFFRTKDDECYYFSISDVRYFDFGKMLYRTAKDEKDFTGGSNQYVNIETGMITKMRIQ